MSTVKNININGTVSKFSAGIYDVTEQNNGKHYSDISQVLSSANTDIPSNDRFPGMQIKFIIDKEATYSVTRADNLTEEPTGTALENTSSIQSGTYNESELSIVFGTLPQTTGSANAVTYYFENTVDETTTYTTWTITRLTNVVSEYVQYRLIKNTWSITETDWQGVDAEPAAESENLVKSGGTDNRINLLPLKHSPFCIMTTTWAARESHWAIPVVGGEKVEWHRTGNDRTLFFAYLTSYSSPVIGQTPSFLSGYESRRTSVLSFVIPNGCKYFIITYLSDLSYLKINGYDILGGIWPVILKQVGNENIEDGAVSSQKLSQEFVERINDIGDNLEELEQASIKESDLTIESRRTNNMANPANIMTGLISNTGAIRTDVTTWEMIKVDVTPGTVVSFGGFNLGRNGYAAFYNANNEKQGSLITLYYSNGVQLPIENKSVPEDSTVLYISIKSPESPEDPYSELMVNEGTNLLPYESYSISLISEINGCKVLSADPTLVERVSELEEEVEELIEQSVTIPDLIADLPVSDGSTIESGYAYIDSSSYNVKVKQ